jgi:heme/copper-type cytochrome/quinol oxidase subunit 2
MWIGPTAASDRPLRRRRCPEPMRRAIILAVFLALGAVVLLAPLPDPSPGPAEREVVIRARQYAFTPGVIRVSQGARVMMVLEAEDVTHGLYVDGYGVDLVAAPGRRARSSFVADREGKFRLRCSKVCGSLHPFMLGELVVEPNGPWWRAVGLTILTAAGTVTYLTVGRTGARREVSA